MIALWDTSGTEVVAALAAERRSAGGVVSGLALTLVAVVDEKRVREAEIAAATAAAAHPCRLLIVVRSGYGAGNGSRLDAEVVVGGRLGRCEGAVLRLSGELTRHADSVVSPLLAPDAPVVTWWHTEPPEQIAADPLGAVAERRITDVAQSADPIAALRQRALDYAPGDTDLAWTRLTPWRALIASAVDTVAAPVVAAGVTAGESDPPAALIRGWLADRLGLEPQLNPAGREITAVWLELAGGERIDIESCNGLARLRQAGGLDRMLPLPHRSLGDYLAEELRHLGADHSYARALSAATGVSDLPRGPAPAGQTQTG